MRIEIQQKRATVDEPLRAHIERRIGAAIGRFGEFIERVVVQFANGNGAADKSIHQCRIRVLLVPSGDVEVEDKDLDVYTLTSRAAARTNLALMSELWRRRESKKR